MCTNMSFFNILNQQTFSDFNARLGAWIDWRFNTSSDFVSVSDFDIFNKITSFEPLLNSKRKLFSLDTESLDMVNNTFDVFHYSIPNIKLYYPEPFIASPTFIHEDIWFLHIAIYQYWLWFFFMSTIIFFFLVYLVTLRWCNIRYRPVRETRGVSRSKCGDLITATVPVSWAASIIIHESTDAIEIGDGFGSTEMAIGIRAYQWGWEYYYPKDMNLNFKNNTNNFYLGNSLKYSSASEKINELSTQKVSLYSSDYLHTSKTPSSYILLSNWNNATVNSLQNLNFGNNKLIARKATNIITSPRTLNLNNLLKNQIFFNDAPTFLNTFNNYFYETSVYPKPVYTYHQTSNLNANNLFNLYTNFSNLHNLNQFLKSSNPSTWELWKGYKLTNVNTKNLTNFFNTFKSRYLKTSDWSVQSVSNTLENKQLVNNTILNYKSLLFKLSTEFKNHNWLINSAWPVSSLMADQDFKRWAANELLEDVYWDNSILAKDFLTFFTEIKLNTSFDNESSTNHLPFVETDNFIHTTIDDIVFFKDFSNQDNLNPVSLSLNTNFKPINLINLSNLNIYVNKTWLSDLLINNFFIFKLNTSLNYVYFNNLFYTFVNSFKFLSVYDLLNFYNLYSNLLYKTDTNNINQDTLVSRYFLFSNWDYITVNKNLNTFSQAFWKVFKSTLDEQRSNFNFYKLSNIKHKTPLLTQQLPSLLSNLQKNNNSFYNLITFKLTPNYELNIPALENIWSSFTFSFPFALSFESDIIRYSWYDWYSTRNTIITKAMDTSVFSLYGAKSYNYTFTNDPAVSLINKTDNFFTKYTHARKLYTQSYIYTPFFYSRLKNWFIWDNFYKLSNELNNLQTSLQLLDLSNSFFTYSNSTYFNKFNANFSNTSSPLRSYFTTTSVLSNYTDILSQLFDILTKREYLYRKFILNKNVIILPESYITNNSNPIVQDLKLSLLDTNLNKPTSSKSYFIDSYKHYTNFIENKEKNLYVKKNPYQPMRKGIVNMIRIQADKAVAMPVDTRLQILAVSKDIIHSWSIPSAGIKIDCIPGYSSHRVAIFVLTGIYWGQCMEICGRFHHWMPIVVYFMRRDLFFMWCIHFIFKNKQMNSIVQSFDKQEVNTSDLISYTPYNWVYEL